MKINKIAIIFFILISFQSFSKPILVQIDSLKELPDDTVKIELINNFLWENKFGGINDVIVQLGIYNKKKAIEIGDYAKAGTALKNTAAIFYYGGNYDSAIFYYQQSLKYYKKANYSKGIAASYQNLGNIYFQQANYKKALKYYFESLPRYEAINYQKGISSIYDAIGNVYKADNDKGNLEKSLKYYRKAFDVKNQFGNEPILVYSYIRIGDVFLTQSTDNVQYTDSSLYYFRKAKKIINKYNMLKYMGVVYDGLGSIFRLREENDSAYFYFKESLKLKKEMKNTFGIVSTKKYLAEYFMSVGNNDSATYYYNEAINDAREINADQIIHDIALVLSDIYKNNKDYKKSLELYQEYVSIHDSLQNDEAKKHMARLEMQYEFDKKEKLKEAEIKRQKVISRGAIGGLIFMIFMAIFIFRSYKSKKRANELLYEKNNKIEHQKDVIEEQNENIKDSIIYAQRIQQAVLPPKDFLNDYFTNHFVLFKPRDIVSGDYYWAKKKNNKLIFTVADCTGHGVPGAFMSLLGISFLNEIITHLYEEEIEAAIILSILREKIKVSLKQTGKSNENKDGMDMALCVIDKDKNTLSFAGANNPLIIVRDGKLIEHKADRMPVGIYFKEDEGFTNNIIEIKPKDKFYLFSDGYVDQFGGEKGRKFMSKRFKKLLLDLDKEPLTNQKEILDNTIEEWINYQKDGKNWQIDDIIVMGLEY